MAWATATIAFLCPRWRMIPPLELRNPVVLLLVRWLRGPHQGHLAITAIPEPFLRISGPALFYFRLDAWAWPGSARRTPGQPLVNQEQDPFPRQTAPRTIRPRGWITSCHYGDFWLPARLQMGTATVRKLLRNPTRRRGGQERTRVNGLAQQGFRGVRTADALVAVFVVDPDSRR